MRIVEKYSHLNGEEHIRYHKPELWAEMEKAIVAVDAHSLRTKRSKEKRMKGKALFAPKALNRAFKREFERLGWAEARVDYWVTSDVELVRRTMQFPAPEQKKAILEAGKVPFVSYNQTDFVKDKVAVEVQFGKYAFIAFDLFVKHLAFYVGSKINVGVEILPMKEMQSEMSSGIGYYERELYNLLRQGRTSPPVPLVLIGVAP
jgi:hypothetical protein